jgi:hypothetical protein
VPLQSDATHRSDLLHTLVKRDELSYPCAFGRSQEVRIHRASSLLQVIRNIEPDFPPRNLDRTMIDGCADGIGYALGGTPVDAKKDESQLSNGNVRDEK